MWQPIPRPTSWSSSARVEMLWGQPEQKYGVRGAGASAARSMRIRGERFVVPQPGQRPHHNVTGHRAVPRDQGPALAVLLPVDARLGGLAVQGGLELLLHHGRLVLDDQHLVRPMDHGPQGERAERPGQVDLHQAQAEVVLVVRAEAEVTQGTLRGGVRHARGQNGQAGADGLAGDAVEAGQFGVLEDPGDAHVDEVLLRL
jgi:hypothetical protein